MPTELNNPHAPLEGSPVLGSKGITSLRSVDYRTDYALAELIDNSIQWGASTVQVVLIQATKKGPHKSRKHIEQILVYDDGLGMDKTTMDICLQYGGGNNGMKSKKLGKFGMGLPNSSGSQSARTEVYSWQSPGETLWNVLDFDELATMDIPLIKPSMKKDIPKTLRALIPHFSKSSGTLVHWMKCDQIRPVTVNATVRRLQNLIGRTYRYFLNSGQVKIYISAAERNENKIKVHPDWKTPMEMRVNDPLFLMTPNNIPDYEEEALFVDDNRNINKVHVGNKVYPISIRFSIVKPEYRDKFKQNHPVNLKHVRPNTGVSLLRGSRELKIGTFGFVKSWADTTERWWGCEVDFPPELDKLFGVTNDKQEARGFRFMDEEDVDEIEADGEDESSALMRKISQHIMNIRNMAQGASKKKKCPSCKKANYQNNKCPDCGYEAEYCDKHKQLLKDGKCGACVTEPIETQTCPYHAIEYTDGECKQCLEAKKPLDPTDHDKLEKYLKDQYAALANDPELLKQALDFYVNSGKSYFLVYISIPGGSFMTTDEFGEILIIQINRRHGFFEKYMGPKLEETGEIEDIIPLHMLIGAMGCVQFKDYNNKPVHEKFNHKFAGLLSDLMSNYDCTQSQE